MDTSQIQKKLKRILQLTVDKDASDLHISANHHPIIRIDRDLQKIREEDKIGEKEAKSLAFEMMTEKEKEKFLENKEVDFAYSQNGSRFRVNVFLQQGKVSASLRRIPSRIQSLKELNLPNHLYQFSKSKQGLVLVTGPTSHGKSTTLAALINKIVTTRFEHIVTIEDPIEYIFDSQKALVDQRELGKDTHSFAGALKSVFRQDPDVIMVGEMRDPETIETAITAAETGHLVFSTLHTNSASQTIHRIVDTFAAQKQEQIRAQLSTSLLGIVSQRLLPSRSGGLIPACEILKQNSAIANLIRENKIHEIDIAIETSSESGMKTLNHYLRDLVEGGKVELETALTYSRNPQHLKKLID